MKSPFPGMDPYLERNWRDVHNALVSGAREALNRILPADLVARTEDRVYVEAEGGDSRIIYPDLRVSPQAPVEMSSAAGGSAAVAEPVLLELDVESVTERFIQILESDGVRVVTAVEFISPANKRAGDEGREAYLQKRREFLGSAANLVEIDLTRSGDWLSLMRPYRVPDEYRTTYRAIVRRARRTDEAEWVEDILRRGGRR